MANKFHDFDEPINRIGTDSFKWDYEGENGKYIPLGVADTDFKAPEEAIAAVRKRTEFGVYAYGALPQERFAASICNWYKKRYGLTVDPETIRHSQGLMTGALWMILNAYTRPGDKVLIQAPVYHTSSIVIKGAGRFVESNDLILEDGRYEMNFEDLEKKVADPRLRIMLICNPHNPVGRVWTKEELLEVAKIKSGSAEPNRKKVASITWDQVRAIATDKMKDLNAFEIEKAMSMVAGTARSMGITVTGDRPF